MQKFATPNTISAQFDIPAGRIRLIAADRSDTTVEVLPADPAKNRDVQAAEQIEVGYADGVLRIAAPAPKNQLFGHSGAVEITVQLPAGSHVEAKAAAAELRGVGRLGDVSFESAQGPVKLDEAAGARIALQGGDISVGRLAGNAELRTMKGDLTVAEARRGTLTLHTESGDVSVGAAREASAVLDAGTTYGRIDNALRNAAGADAELTVHATTGYGDIAARSL
ncbi:DUF4097 family beta strand repeat-containing protein [Streptomyces sp. VRA16 Mangrove soil]|uniref:DUF4097 family beta strand repeat-containing protein n=1 Tax=Streptomyces sp. VRA16 Mangrove soil TaxID=2817434 RepID=UPI001A9F54F5|nr:DUF4097 family beta strand repeat-containing protein [Streptomyces sp. VRA16 Mangrove soil]MBO1334803.1 DUF4097 family beta strand repeat protein [Streptomyces sp. VRA16 Mangrove soil]